MPDGDAHAPSPVVVASLPTHDGELRVSEERASSGARWLRVQRWRTSADGALAAGPWLAVSARLALQLGAALTGYGREAGARDDRRALEPLGPCTLAAVEDDDAADLAVIDRGGPALVALHERDPRRSTELYKRAVRRDLRAREGR